MDRMNSRQCGFWREVLSGAALVCLIVVGAKAEDAAAKGKTLGDVEFDCPNAPKAMVQIDLNQGLFADMFGIGDAAIAGVAEALDKATETKHGENDATTAAAVDAARQIVHLCGEVVKGVQVRVYEPKDKSQSIEKLTAYYEQKLKEQQWETIARVQDDDDMVVVSAIRAGGAFKGVFVIATDGDDLVLTNVVCDISRDNVKKIASAVTKSGLQVQVGQMINPALWSVHAVEVHDPSDAPPAPVADNSTPDKSTVEKR
jgi:Domain of unknown function (DUF4252)